jgi:hypothetical protein
MTDAGDMPAGRIPKRNWAAVVLAVAGAFMLIAMIANGTLRSIPDAPSQPFAVVFGLLLASFVLAPIAILVAFRVFGTGTRSFPPLGGDALGSRLLFVLTALFTLAAQYSLLGPLLFDVGDGGAVNRATTASYILDGAAFVLAIVTSVIILRAGIVRGFARWALPIAAALAIVSVIVSNTLPTDWGDVPHGVAVLFLGVAYWRAGVPVEGPVPAGPESLAE